MAPLLVEPNVVCCCSFPVEMPKRSEVRLVRVPFQDLGDLGLGLSGALGDLALADPGVVQGPVQRADVVPGEGWTQVIALEQRGVDGTVHRDNRLPRCVAGRTVANQVTISLPPRSIALYPGCKLIFGVIDSGVKGVRMRLLNPETSSEGLDGSDRLWTTARTSSSSTARPTPLITVRSCRTTSRRVRSSAGCRRLRCSKPPATLG